MPAAKTLYFAELGPVWADWIQIVNVGNAPTKITCLARNAQGNPVWSKEHTINPFQGWTPPVEEVKQMTWLMVTADQPIVAERHMHRDTQVLDFPGASLETKTAGKRLFFPELVPGALDWFRILNISETDALVTVIVRNSDGKVVRQRSNRIPPNRWWDIDDKAMGDIRGTVEMTSTQNIVAERHLHYKGGQVVVGQLGQLLD